MRQNVSTLGHEMHTAKDNVLAARLRRFLRKFVRIAAKICIANHFVALIMMSKDYYITSKLLPSRSNAVVHGVIGKNQIVFETANLCCRSHIGSRFQLRSSLVGHLGPTTAKISTPERGC